MTKVVFSLQGGKQLEFCIGFLQNVEVRLLDRNGNKIDSSATDADQLQVETGALLGALRERERIMS